MGLWLKQSTAITMKAGPFLDSVDGVTAETALTISQADVRLTKNGGDAAQKNDATSATHDENGWYDVPLNATDTNTLGRLQIFIHESGALPVWHEYMVVPANVWDSFFATDKLQVHADEMTAGLITASVIATGAIDADALAADCITAAKVAADVSAEIADAVWDEDIDAAHQTANTAGKRLDDSSTTVASNLDAAVTTRATPTQVNAEVVDALATDTYTEPGVGAPGVTVSLADKISYLYKFMRNRVTTTSTTITIYNDDTTTAAQQSSHSDNGTTYDRGEFGSA